MALRVLPLILFTSALFALCVCQGRSINYHVNYADCHRSGVHNSTVKSPADVPFNLQCPLSMYMCLQTNV